MLTYKIYRILIYGKNLKNLSKIDTLKIQTYDFKYKCLHVFNYCLIVGNKLKVIPKTTQWTKVWKWKWKRHVWSDSLQPMDYTVHWILQARTLEWVAFLFSKGSSQPRNQTQVSCIAGWFFTNWNTREAQEYWSG